MEGLEDDDLELLRRGLDTVLILLLRLLWSFDFSAYCMQTHILTKDILDRSHHAINVNGFLKTCGKVGFDLMCRDVLLELRKQHL